ncbi:unnamed protein product [Brassica rapa subsp. narinosa]
MDDDDIQAKDIEEKLKSQSSTRLSSTRRDLRLLGTANMEEILRPCFHVISGTETSCFEELTFWGLCSLKLNKSDTGKPNLLDRLRGALHLLSQMTEPILKAARYIRTWDIHSAGLFIFHRIFCDIFGSAFTSPSVD